MAESRVHADQRPLTQGFSVFLELFQELSFAAGQLSAKQRVHCSRRSIDLQASLFDTNLNPVLL